MKIEVTIEEYKSFREKGLTFNALFLLMLLHSAEQGENMPWNTKDPSFAGDTGLLKMKGYIDKEGKLTPTAHSLLTDVPEAKITTPVGLRTDVFRMFVENLHVELQQKLIQLTGKKQKLLQGKYYFLCNAKDLEKKLRDVWTKYGGFDQMKMRNTLLKYVERCHKVGFDKVNLIEYYVMKNDMSRLITDMENSDDTSPDVEAPAPLADPKNLF